MKVDPGAEISTIPLSCYRQLFKKKFTKAGNLKQNALHSMIETWTAHDNTPQQILGYFIIECQT